MLFRDRHFLPAASPLTPTQEGGPTVPRDKETKPPPPDPRVGLPEARTPELFPGTETLC